MDAYYYLHVDQLENVLECGMKLSEWFDREAVIKGESRKCISALLNPRDDLEKYKSEQYRCIRLELTPQQCYIADRCLYLAAEGFAGAMELYIKSIKPVQEYRFGSYRLPECLITGTIIAEHISLLDKRRDSPIIYERSELLYINNIIETFKEENDDFNDVLMYYFYCKLAEIGKVDKIEDNKNRFTIFIDKLTNNSTIIRKPEVV